MASEPVVVSRPPRGSFTPWQRVLRGYGPLAILIIFVILLAYLIPSKVPDKTVDTTNSDSSQSLDDGTSDTLAPGETVPGDAAAQAAAAVNSRTIKGAVVGACTARPDQVPGDPYSPPCISFSGDNGGATTAGVNKTDINVSFRVLNEKGFQQTLAALAGAELVDTPETVTRTVQAMAEYFNTRFQFYGRKLVLKTYPGQGSGTTELLGGGQDKANADARTAKSLNAFADLSGASVPYSDALYSQRILAFGDPYTSRKWHTDRRPYAWSLATDCSILAETVASYTKARLQPFKADFAGGALKGQPRRIAALAPDNSWYQECVSDLRTILTKGGGKDVEMAPQYKLDLNSLSSQAANLVPQLKNAGITTIICGCDPVMPVFFSGEASRQGYYPEFINIGVALDDTDIVGQLWNQTFASHSFGISALGNDSDKPASSTIAYAAYKTVRPNDEPAFSVDLIYYQFYMLAIGVQMAGPNLTPSSFEKGMFDYPEKFGPLGLWGFGPGDYTPQDDVREIYWDPTATSRYNGKAGRWVDPQPGKRYPHGVFPTGPPPLPPQ